MAGAGGMRLELFLSARHPACVRPADAVREHHEQVAIAREPGFSSVWTGRHLLPGMPQADVLGTLRLLAGDALPRTA